VAANYNNTRIFFTLFDRGEYCLIDWKTSQKRRYTLKDCYDDPTQVAAYTGAVNCSLELDNQVPCAEC